ncbi:MAG: hypothetical protein Q9174_005789 [Haloplaca sp. 1 TL-2023]
MLYDRSTAATTQTYGKTSMPFEYGRSIRRIAVTPDLNEFIGMGGATRNLLRFWLSWQQDYSNVIKAQTQLPHNDSEERELDPHHARTHEEPDTELPSRMETRIHTPGGLRRNMRYLATNRLGSGTFGQVYKAVDVDTGRLMAVKMLRQPARECKREVETLQSIKHPHIVDYIDAQEGSGNTVEIFMGLKDGTLETLVEADKIHDFSFTSKVTNMVLRQMLQALDFLVVKGIIHRDVKPANILYSLPQDTDDPYRFQLGDFGLCNRLADAKTHVGTKLFMAPEVYADEKQTHAADIWSLFVTIRWTLDVDGFRNYARSGPRHQDLWSTIMQTASTELFPIRSMAQFKVSERATAAQILVELFDAEGLSTPRQRVPSLVDYSGTQQLGETSVDRRFAKAELPPYEKAYPVDIKYKTLMDWLPTQK